MLLAAFDPEPTSAHWQIQVSVPSSTLAKIEKVGEPLSELAMTVQRMSAGASRHVRDCKIDNGFVLKGAKQDGKQTQ